MLGARIISYISNPIFILIGLPYFLINKTTHDPILARDWTLVTWSFLFVFVLFVLVGVKSGFFSDIDVSKRTQRPLLYLFGAILALIYVFVLLIFHGPAILFITILGIILAIFCGSIVNMRVKASVHVASATALITGLIAGYGGYYYLLILLIPIICWARIRIKRHSFHEVVAGGILGSLLSLIMFLITRQIFHL